MPGAIETDAYAFDPERARQALAASSYGRPEDVPEVVWYVAGSDPWSVTEGEWLASQFREVLGVQLTVTPVDDDAFDALWSDDPASFPQMGAFSWFVDNPDPHEWFSGFFTCGGTYYAARVGYCNRELDALLARADAQTDPEERLALYEEAGHLVVADVATIFVYTPTNITLVKPNVTGYSTAVPQEWPGWLTPLTLDIALAE